MHLALAKSVFLEFLLYTVGFGPSPLLTATLFKTAALCPKVRRAEWRIMTRAVSDVLPSTSDWEPKEIFTRDRTAQPRRKAHSVGYTSTLDRSPLSL